MPDAGRWGFNWDPARESDIIDYIISTELVRLVVLENERLIRMRGVAFLYILLIYGLLIVATITAIFFQGFNWFGFKLDTALLKWLGAAILGEVAGIAVTVYGALFRNTLTSGVISSGD